MNQGIKETYNKNDAIYESSSCLNHNSSHS